eukprot:TRINITY_DN10647_c0_g1_i1.p1 TRINITY_DN10647_c0_g1~~TRINITY_DN10647_c0_g1_i1.p1  ORF type:complete len:223 (+),score=55.32 TRINITY_DN10647_c0_g1_i1:29-697(+)
MSSDPFGAKGPTKRGVIWKKGGSRKNWKKRYLEVGNGVVQYRTKAGGPVKGVIQVRDISNVDVDDSHKTRDFTFSISTDQRVYIMQATDSKNRSQWVEVISQMKKEFFAGINKNHSVFKEDKKKLPKAYFNDSQTQLNDTGEVVAVAPDTKDPWFWTTREVVNWMKSLGLSNDWSKFIYDNFVDGETLIDEMLEEIDWREVGVTFKGDIDILVHEGLAIRQG